MEFLKAENFCMKENFTGLRYETPNLRTYTSMCETFLESFSFGSASNISN